MSEKQSPNSTNAEFFGHPAGLSTLFFTEMWERMSYYGMRALLVLYMTASLQEQGLGLTVATATAIYGLYTGAVYFMGLPGGWIADRLLGGQQAVFWGGFIIMCGHMVLALPFESTFFIGLILVVLGTGLLKPNISALVGALYSAQDTRRDAGYTLYYMGINIGSFIGQIVCGYLASDVGWHWGFGAAAVGMAAGLIQYKITIGKLQGVADKPIIQMSASSIRKAWASIAVFLAAIAIITGMMLLGTLSFNPVALAQVMAFIITIIFLSYFAFVLIFGKLDPSEFRRTLALFLICVASSCFWAGFEQAGSSLNLFARDYTNRIFGTYEVPAAWFQSLNPLYIFLLSPFFAALWINLSKRMLDPSYGIKCSIGIMIMASGFIVMFFAAQLAASGMKVSANFLIATYFLHTVGELCLSPVALSAVSKLSPRRFTGQMMGAFILTYSVGSVIAGLLAGRFDPENLSEMPNLYLQITVYSVGIGAVILLLSLKTRLWEKLAEKE